MFHADFDWVIDPSTILKMPGVLPKGALVEIEVIAEAK